MSTTDLTIFTDNGFTTTLKIAETLVKSGVLPRGIDNPFKAFAIIQKGREIGVGPMRALTGIALIEGKPTVSPELKLEQFRQRGGHVKWVKSDNTIAHLHLKAPNGDEHEETVTLEDMKLAGVASKDNWRKYPKSMLRARAVGFGLRALGEGDGSYTPDELGAVTNESGEAEYIPPKESETPKAPAAAPSAAVPTPSAATTSKPPRAPSIKHDGTFASHKQVALLHILKGKTGLADCKGDCAVEVIEEKKWGKKTTRVQRCPYHTQLAAFKDCDGKPIMTSKDLSEAQISNLIDRYEAKIKQQEARASETPEIPFGDAGSSAGTTGGGTSTTTTATDDELSEVRAALDEKGDTACLDAICEVFRCPTIDDLPKHEAPAALALVLAWNTKAYAQVLARVRP